MNGFLFRALAPALALAPAATNVAAQTALRAPPSFTVVCDKCTEFAGLGPLAVEPETDLRVFYC